jgi:hypothetical protein
MTLDALTAYKVYARLLDLRRNPRLFDDRRTPSRVERRWARINAWLGVLTSHVFMDWYVGKGGPHTTTRPRHVRRHAWDCNGPPPFNVTHPLPAKATP